MASYQAKIQLLVEGAQKLKQLEDRLKQLQSKVEEVNGKSVDPLSNAITNQKKLVKSQKESVEAKRSEILQQIKLNAAVSLYNRRLKEASNIGVGKKQDRESLEKFEQAFAGFKQIGDVQGINDIATAIGRIVEDNRQIKRQELDRVKSSQKIKDAVSEVNRFAKQGLDVSKAQVALDRAKVLAGTNKNAQNKSNLFLLDKELQKLRQQSAELDRQAKLKAKQKGSAIIGGAFPLLFGQGPGAAVGGAIGGALGEKSGIGGFAGSLAGTAVGDFLDTAVVRAAELAEALSLSTSNMQGLRDAGLEVTSTLENQVSALTRVGRGQEAQQLAIQEAGKQTGDLEGKLGQLVSGSLSELQKAWNGVLNSVSTLVGVLAAPFINVLTAALRAVQALSVGFNALLSVVAQIGRIGGFGDALTDQAIRTSEEYQKRQVELEKEGRTLRRNLDIKVFSNEILARSIGLNAEQTKALNNQEKVLGTILKTEQEVAEARERLGQGRTPEERQRIEANILAIQQKGIQERTKLELEAFKQIADKRLQQNISVRKFNEDTERQRERIATSVERKIFDLKLKNQRALEDLELKRAKAELDFEKQVTKFNQERRASAQEIQSIFRSLSASISTDPQANIGAQIQDASEKYQLAVQTAQENRALSEREIALRAQESAVRIERLKLDNARAIAKFNQDTATKVETLRARVLEKRRAIAVFESGVIAFQAQTVLLAKKAQLESALAGEKKKQAAGGELGEFAGIQVEALEAQIKALDDAVKSFQKNFKTFEGSIPKPTEVESVQGVGTVDVQDISAQQTATEGFISSLQNKIALLQKEGQVTEATKNLITNYSAIVDGFTSKIGESNNSLTRQQRLIELTREQLNEGVSPELAETLAQMALDGEEAAGAIDMILDAVYPLIETNPEMKEFADELQRIKENIPGSVRSNQEGVKNVDAMKKSIELESYMGRLRDQINDVNGMIISLSDTVISEMSNAMSSAITGVITGTTTVEEAMSTMFANIGKAFIDMATQMIAKALILKALGALGGGGTMGGEGYYDKFTGLGTAGPNFGLADGGPTRPHGTYLVGERGPELLTMGTQSGFVHSNTSEAMDRYRAGGSGGGGGGSLDVNYNVTQINGMNFVTEEQFRAGMSRAAKDGAKMGEAGTFKSMKNSRSSRRRVGI